MQPALWALDQSRSESPSQPLPGSYSEFTSALAANPNRARGVDWAIRAVLAGHRARDVVPAAGRPGELRAADDVQVQVEDGLARALARVGDEPEVVEAFLLGDGRIASWWRAMATTAAAATFAASGLLRRLGLAAARCRLIHFHESCLGLILKRRSCWS